MALQTQRLQGSCGSLAWEVWPLGCDFKASCKVSKALFISLAIESTSGLCCLVLLQLELWDWLSGILGSPRPKFLGRAPMSGAFAAFLDSLAVGRHPSLLSSEG